MASKCRQHTNMVAKHIQKDSSKGAPRKPAIQNAGNSVHLQQCGHHQHLQPANAAPGRSSEHQELVNGDSSDDQAGKRGQLLLTLASPACRCSCDVAPVPPVLRDSPFLKPARELLNEVVCMKDVVDTRVGGGNDEIEHGKSKSYSLHDKDSVQVKLISLLTELESRYEQYVEEMNQVVSSFESALGSGATAWYTSLMIQAMSRHFARLRSAILSKLQDEDDGVSALAACRRSSRTVRQRKQAAARHDVVVAAAVRAQQVWRPLRGLPEDSVAVLRAWLFEHFLHPYPDDNEKLRLAVNTGLTRNQISNWFINARVRLWKPMVEEMYHEEFSEDSRER